jgi:putative protein kinase ArgK-like GTPase of G3E family
MPFHADSPEALYILQDFPAVPTDAWENAFIPRVGDELQGIKRGIIEMVDGIVINKAHGENLREARGAQSQFETALRMFAPNRQGWQARVLTCSALEKQRVNGSGI